MSPPTSQNTVVIRFVLGGAAASLKKWPDLAEPKVTLISTPNNPPQCCKRRGCVNCSSSFCGNSSGEIEIRGGVGGLPNFNVPGRHIFNKRGGGDGNECTIVVGDGGGFAVEMHHCNLCNYLVGGYCRRALNSTNGGLIRSDNATPTSTAPAQRREAMICGGEDIESNDVVNN